MLDLVLLIPVLRRPQNILPLINSIEATTSGSYEILFIASPADIQEIDALEHYKANYFIMPQNHEGNGDYAKKINAGFNEIEATWYLTGADDLEFYPKWFDFAMATASQTGSCVIGTNDLGSPRVTSGQHATHSLVLREYALECGTIDEPGKVLHEGYKHNFVDVEFVDTAKWRGAWSFAINSKVEHLHPDWNRGSMDEVYKIGKSGWDTDQQYFEKRKRLWI